MPVLKHALLDGFHLPHPVYEEDNLVLQHLQKLSGIINFKCSEEVVKRIPNIMKLGFEWRPPRLDEEEKGFPDLCLENLGHLQNLKSLNLDIDLADISHEVLTGSHLVQRIDFPRSLKKLTLKGTLLEWEELTTKIGSLPRLEYLKLDMFSCDGLYWETEEGKFCSLKFLHVGVMTSNLMRWTTDSTHFPRLEHLVLANLEELEGIPSSIGDIPTLKSIKVVSCSKSAEDSARRLKEEQEDYGNEVLQVLILEELEEY